MRAAPPSGSAVKISHTICIASVIFWKENGKRSQEIPALNAEFYDRIQLATLVDLRGHQERAPPPGPNSFIFMQFSGKIWPNNRLASPSWRQVPPPPVWGNPGSVTEQVVILVTKMAWQMRSSQAYELMMQNFDVANT